MTIKSYCLDYKPIFLQYKYRWNRKTKHLLIWLMACVNTCSTLLYFFLLTIRSIYPTLAIYNFMHQLPPQPACSYVPSHECHQKVYIFFNKYLLWVFVQYCYFYYYFYYYYYCCQSLFKCIFIFAILGIVWHLTNDWYYFVISREIFRFLFWFSILFS